MDCETNDCRKEKRGCKGCYYYEKKDIIEAYNKLLERIKKENGVYCHSKFCQNKCYKHIDNKKENK